jgi:hypothetical protein
LFIVTLIFAVEPTVPASTPGTILNTSVAEAPTSIN